MGRGMSDVWGGIAVIIGIPLLGIIGKGCDEQARNEITIMAEAQDVDGLIRSLGNYEHAIKPLAQIGKPVVTPLLDWISAGGQNERTRACQAISLISDTNAIPLLIEGLWLDNIFARRACKNALSGIGEPAIEPLVECLDSKNEEVVVSAALALAYIGDVRSIAALATHLGRANTNGSYEEQQANRLLTELYTARLSSAFNVSSGMGTDGIAYLANRPKPSPLIILDSRGNIHSWCWSMPPSWWQFAYNDENIELVVILGDWRSEVVSTQKYFTPLPFKERGEYVKNPDREPITVTSYRKALDVAIYEASTGKRIYSTTLHGSAPPAFPDEWKHRYPRLEGSIVRIESLENWLKQYVER